MSRGHADALARIEQLLWYSVRQQAAQGHVLAAIATAVAAGGGPSPELQAGIDTINTSTKALTDAVAKNQPPKP